MSLSNNPEFIKFAARLEREMDSGETPFVVLDGTRYPVTPKQVEKFGLVSGQTISQLIMDALIADLESIAFNSVLSEILGTKSPDEKFEPGVDTQEIKDELKDTMEEKAAKQEELFRQRELQPRTSETEDINSKGSPEVFGGVDWPDPKEDTSFDNTVMGNLPEPTPVKDGPLDTFNERTSENFSSGKPD